MPWVLHRFDLGTAPLGCASKSHCTQIPTNQKRMADLYIASRSDKPNVYKIGKSSNTLSRCKQLQRGHCFKIYVNAILESKGSCEKSIHRALREYQIGDSEWFDIDLDTVLVTADQAQPAQHIRQQYDLEALAQYNLSTGKTLRSTRYPHLRA